MLVWASSCLPSSSCKSISSFNTKVAKNFREKLIELSTFEMEQQNSELETYFEEWKGSEEQVDDVCIIGIRI